MASNNVRRIEQLEQLNENLRQSNFLAEDAMLERSAQRRKQEESDRARAYVKLSAADRQQLRLRSEFTAWRAQQDGAQKGARQLVLSLSVLSVLCFITATYLLANPLWMLSVSALALLPLIIGSLRRNPVKEIDRVLIVTAGVSAGSTMLALLHGAGEGFLYHFALWAIAFCLISPLMNNRNLRLLARLRKSQNVTRQIWPYIYPDYPATAPDGCTRPRSGQWITRNHPGNGTIRKKIVQDGFLFIDSTAWVKQKPASR